jgi:hypothetical protein
MIKKKRVTEQFLRKWTSSAKRAKFDLLTLEKIPFNYDSTKSIS